MHLARARLCFGQDCHFGFLAHCGVVDDVKSQLPYFYLSEICSIILLFAESLVKALANFEWFTVFVLKDIHSFISDTISEGVVTDSYPSPQGTRLR